MIAFIAIALKHAWELWNAMIHDKAKVDHESLKWLCWKVAKDM